MMYRMIILKNVCKSYGKSDVLKSVSFRIDPKEFVCITGPSGAGKSTLLHIMMGAEEASKGSISVDQVDLNDLPPTVLQLFRRRIGVAFQDYKLLWNRTVEENVAFPLEVSGVHEDEIEKRVKQILKEMSLTKHKDTLASALSGGEKARASIARAYVHEPMILFADEPTGNLDPDQTDMIIELLEQIHKNGTTVILATHEADIVDKLQTRVLRLEEGELIRDSVGGYDKESKKVSRSKPKGLHDIFDEGDGVRIEVSSE